MHSHHAHRAHKASKHRVKHIMHGYKRGGSVKHEDLAEDVSLIKKAVHKHDTQLHGKGKHTDLSSLGHARGGRLDKYARGGKTKGKHHTQVNIAVVSPHGGSPAPGGPPPGGGGLALPPGGPPRPPMAGPPGGMPMGGPPGMPPGMPPKPPGMMKRGGGVKSTKPAHIGKHPAGGDNGEGRLMKARKYGLKPRKGH